MRYLSKVGAQGNNVVKWHCKRPFHGGFSLPGTAWGNIALAGVFELDLSLDKMAAISQTTFFKCIFVNGKV